VGQGKRSEDDVICFNMQALEKASSGRGSLFFYYYMFALVSFQSRKIV
jgi:hypothetical protein